MVSLDPVGDGLHRRRAALASPQMNLDRRREHARLENVGEFAHLPARALEGLLLRDIVDAIHLGKFSNVLHRGGDRLDVGAVAEKRAHFDALLHLVQRFSDVDGDEPEQSECEKRERDGYDTERTE